MTLEAWMAAQKLNDEQVAAQIGRKRPLISKLRRRKILPSLETARRLQKLTNGLVGLDDWENGHASDS